MTFALLRLVTFVEQLSLFAAHRPGLQTDNRDVQQPPSTANGSDSAQVTGKHALTPSHYVPDTQEGTQQPSADAIRSPSPFSAQAQQSFQNDSTLPHSTQVAEQSTKHQTLMSESTHYPADTAMEAALKAVWWRSMRSQMPMLGCTTMPRR